MKVLVNTKPKEPVTGAPNITVDVDQWDVWSVTGTLSAINAAVLKKYKEMCPGYFNIDAEDLPPDFRWTTHKNKSLEQAFNDKLRWQWLLDELIWTFETLQTPWMTDQPNAKARIDNGLRLFGKYYLFLWD